MDDDHDLPLGRPTAYPTAYDPGLLVTVPRATTRRTLGIEGPTLPFVGEDRWTAYEVSWLDAGGRPTAMIGEIVVPCGSPRLVESKSLKLYLGSLNGAVFADAGAAGATIAADLSGAAGAPVAVRLWPAGGAEPALGALPGRCIDDAPIERPGFALDPGLLEGAAAGAPEVEAAVYTHLFRSRCPITAQPDWASVWIRYRGPAIADAPLLAYLLSFREHGEFHEHCVERIFADVRARCRPAALTVAARFTRRGGLDINPWRSTFEEALALPRLTRQ